MSIYDLQFYLQELIEIEKNPSSYAPTLDVWKPDFVFISRELISFQKSQSLINVEWWLADHLLYNTNKLRNNKNDINYKNFIDYAINFNTRLCMVKCVFCNWHCGQQCNSQYRKIKK